MYACMCLLLDVHSSAYTYLLNRILGIEFVHEDGQDSLDGFHVEVQEGLIICDGVDDALHIQLTQLS